MTTQGGALEFRLGVAAKDPGKRLHGQEQICQPEWHCQQKLSDKLQHEQQPQQLPQPHQSQSHFNNQTQHEAAVGVSDCKVPAPETGHNPISGSQATRSRTWLGSRSARLAARLAERIRLPMATLKPHVTRRLLLPARKAANCATWVGCTMDCRQARRQVREASDLDSDSELRSSSSSGDIIHVVSNAFTPVRISSRHLHLQELVHQRAQAAICFGSDVAPPQRRTRVALFERTATPGVLPYILRGESRMSNMTPEDMDKMVGDIKECACVNGSVGQGNIQVNGRGCYGLEGRLDSFGMCMKEMKGDGNCQFRSLAFNLFGDQDHHAMTRKAAVAHMRKHANFFGSLFEDVAEFNAYLSDMARARTWGDELTLRACIEAYNCEAHIITSEPANWYLVYQSETSSVDPAVAVCPPKKSLPRPGKQVFLAYVSPVHYNSIVRKKQT